VESPRTVNASFRSLSRDHHVERVFGPFFPFHANLVSISNSRVTPTTTFDVSQMRASLLEPFVVFIFVSLFKAPDLKAFVSFSPLVAAPTSL